LSQFPIWKRFQMLLAHPLSPGASDDRARIGDRVNFEIDLLARYVARLAGT